MWVSSQQIESESRKEAEDSRKGVTHSISKAALRRKKAKQKAARAQ